MERLALLGSGNRADWLDIPGGLARKAVLIVA